MRRAPPSAGSPSPPEELDPELLRLRLPRARLVSPVISGAVLVIVVYVMGFRLRDDFMYALRSRTPQDLGMVTRAGAAPPVLPGDNSFVTLQGVPDRGFPMRVGGGKDMGWRVARVLGTGGRLLLQLRGDDTGADARGTDHYTGRLRLLSKLPYGRDAASYLRKARAPRRVAPAQLAELAQQRQASDVIGESFVVEPEAQVVLTEEVADHALVDVPRVIFPDRAAADALVTGVGDAGTPTLLEEGETVYRYRVPTGPTGIEGLRSALRAKSASASVSTEVREHRGALSTLKVTGSEVALGDGKAPLGSLKRALIYAPVVPPGTDPLVLQAGERPAEYWYYPVIFGVLFLFFLFNAWGLYRLLRERQRARAQATPAAEPSR